MAEIKLGRFCIIDIESNGYSLGLIPGCDIAAELALRPVMNLTLDEVAAINAMATAEWTPAIIASANPVQQQPTLVQAQVAAHLAIDAQAGATRRKYITDATGQDATYLQKAAEAKAYVAAGYPSAAIASYPMVRAMTRLKYGPTPTAAQCQLAADHIIATEAAWVQKGADIEEARLAGKDAVTAALTVVDVQTAQTAAIAALVAL